MLTPRGGGGRAYVGYLIINCIPTLGILISILAPSWGNLNRMTFINIVFIAKWWGIKYLTNIYCPTVGHLIENLLKKSNAPPMPPPPRPLGLNIDRCIIKIYWQWLLPNIPFEHFQLSTLFVFKNASKRDLLKLIDVC
jgi:hypothetical protein